MKTATSVALVALMMMTLNATASECEDKVNLAIKQGIFYNLKATPGGLIVVIDESVWRSVDFQAKTGMVDALNCAIAGPDKVIRTIEFHSNMTDRILGRYSWGKLTVSE